LILTENSQDFEISCQICNHFCERSTPEPGVFGGTTLRISIKTIILSFWGWLIFSQIGVRLALNSLSVVW
ncbi:hypothetical protein, partial [uncultured Gimesia sp.]|uniref:hypothetical protein n=1 Tax=uncultured Gimesia sp. TaxID=1678688 RepID=UPI002610124A